MDFVGAAQSGGSIPACAGEPFCYPLYAPACGVYPRVCGGTICRIPQPPGVDGLSPRVRGNRPDDRGNGACRGSIPACAGEPKTPFRIPTAAPVYPRVCGGTPASYPPAGRLPGLSPRVRGNRAGDCARPLVWRSIPACAGEPPGRRKRGPGRRVYPRVCGGTRARPWPAKSCQGLSPRVRGNPAVALGGVGQAGSIPACAGEPITGDYPQPSTAVYPRVCGGTWLGYLSSV